MNAPNRNPPSHEIVTRRAPLSGGASWNPEERTLRAVISTGAPVERWDGRGPFVETLDLRGMTVAPHVPLLNSHSRGTLSDVLGSVVSTETKADRIEATLKLSRRDDVEDIVTDIVDGHVSGVSIGYRVQEWREEAESAGKPRRKTATRWTLVEASLVVIPADASATLRGDQTMDPVTTQNTGEPATTPAPQNTPAPVATRSEQNAAIRSIAELSGLPREWADQQIDAERSVEDVRAAAFDAMRARAAAAGSVRSTSVQVIADHNDPEVRIRAAGEAFYARYTPGHQLSDRARAFVGMGTIDLARDCLRSANVSTSGMSAGQIVERALHSTSDFPLILGDSIGRTLRASYAAAPSGLKQVGRQTTARDFKDKHRLQLSEAPRLEKVNESGEFKSGTLAEAKESYRLATYGRIIGITRQALVNDDLSAFSDLARRMGQAAAATEAQLLVDLLISGSGNGPAMSDSKALFHADHKNKASAGAAPDVGPLSIARTAMRRQVGLKGELIDVTPKFIIVPPELETDVEKLLATITAAEAANVNPFSGKLAIVVEPRLVSAKRWYLSADPASIDGLEFAYLEGEEGVQIETKAGFEVDGVQIRARLDFGAGFVDHRGWHMNPGE